MTTPIYLDYNATTPIAPEVINVITQCLTEFGNPSSSHDYGRRANEIVRQARAHVAHLIRSEERRVGKECRL